MERGAWPNKEALAGSGEGILYENGNEHLRSN